MGEIDMTTARQDAWNQDEDLLLAEVVLRHIREGSTQLAAFEEVGKKLSRTSAACGFRWNSYVRKQYQQAIQIAKEQRKGKRDSDYNQPVFNQEEDIKKESPANRKEDDIYNKSINFSQVLAFLKKHQSLFENYQDILNQNSQLSDTVHKLRQENDELVKENARLKEKCETIEEDYKSLIEIMERARKMFVFNEENNQQVRFQMDKNGNLERVEK